MRHVRIIGVGPGDPEHITVQAIKALNATDVFFLVDKGREKHDLVDLRKQICERYVENASYRFVEVRDPERDRSAPGYRSAVEDWRRRRADVYERLIETELDEDRCGAFLVLGDPSLYDGTLAIVSDIAARGNVAFSYDVVPGVTSVQALAAAHRIGLNRVGDPIHITTGRRLANEGFPDCSNDVVVMLDADCTFSEIADPDTHIYWGAYLGTTDEILVSGRVSDVSEQIQQVRRKAREEKGWVMDTYLLRAPPRADKAAPEDA